MNKDRLPVVAAIPTFNEEQHLANLLDQVLEQEYEAVYVLDDASTDNTLELALGYGNDVHVVEGSKNLGSAGNRNRIIPNLGYRAVIHFLDGDVRLDTPDSPDRARQAIAGANIGYIGGLIKNEDGDQLIWNYGPAFSVAQMFSARQQVKLDKLAHENPAKAAEQRADISKSSSVMRQWPNTLITPEARQVYWAAEANTVFNSDTFAAVGGYDPNLRYHEAMDLAMRMEAIGLKRYFDPSLSVTHLDNGYEDKSKTKNFWIAWARIIRKMGLRNFILSPPFDQLGCLEDPEPIP